MGYTNPPMFGFARFPAVSHHVGQGLCQGAFRLHRSKDTGGKNAGWGGIQEVGQVSDLSDILQRKKKPIGDPVSPVIGHDLQDQPIFSARTAVLLLYRKEIRGWFSLFFTTRGEEKSGIAIWGKRFSCPSWMRAKKSPTKTDRPTARGF